MYEDYSDLLEIVAVLTRQLKKAVAEKDMYQVLYSEAQKKLRSIEEVDGK